jgi:Cu-Zn family superoxide dismutase
VHKRWNVLVVAIGIAALASGSVALADHGGGKQGKHGKGTTQVFTLDPSPHGNPEGVATRGGGKVFFVGATGDGTIYRGTVGNPTVTEFIAGAAGKSAVGMKIRGGKLYVAGGMTGKIYVYSLRTKELLATFDTGSGGFLNDRRDWEGGIRHGLVSSHALAGDRRAGPRRLGNAPGDPGRA